MADAPNSMGQAAGQLGQLSQEVMGDLCCSVAGLCRRFGWQGWPQFVAASLGQWPAEMAQVASAPTSMHCRQDCPVLSLLVSLLKLTSRLRDWQGPAARCMLVASADVARTAVDVLLACCPPAEANASGSSLGLAATPPLQPPWMVCLGL